MDRKKIIAILLMLTLAFIWGNSLLSREVSGIFSDRVMDMMNSAAEALGFGPELFTVMADTDGDGTLEPSSNLVRKIAHITEYAVLGILLWLRLDGVRKRGAAVLTLGTAAAVIDEILQLFSDRGSQFIDVFIDAFGVALGLSLMAAAASLRTRGER